VICANGARSNYRDVVLEVQFSTELNDSRIESGGNLAKSAVAKVIADGVELGVIPGESDPFSTHPFRHTLFDTLQPSPP